MFGSVNAHQASYDAAQHVWRVVRTAIDAAHGAESLRVVHLGGRPTELTVWSTCEVPSSAYGPVAVREHFAAICWALTREEWPDWVALGDACEREAIRAEYEPPTARGRKKVKNRVYKAKDRAILTTWESADPPLSTSLIVAALAKRYAGLDPDEVDTIVRREKQRRRDNPAEYYPGQFCLK